jgi:DNA-binding NtrC family response regulator
MGDVNDEQRIIDAQAAFEEAEAARRKAIVDALRNHAVKQARIAEITGLSRETLRVWRKAAGIPADERYVRTVRGKEDPR